MSIEYTEPWWFTHLVTFLGTLIAAAMIVYQLGRQHKNETNRQNENFKGQLRLQIYQEFSDCLTSASDSISTAGLYARTSHTRSAIFRAQVDLGTSPQPISERPLVMLDEKKKALEKAIEVIFLIEKYYIVHPDLDIFRSAISCAIHDINVAFNPLFDFMIRNFPVDVQSESGWSVVRVKALDDKELSELQVLSGALADSFSDLDCYLTDLRTELQQLLLGYLFPNTVPKRRPADPSKKVITLDPAFVKTLRNHFLKNTAWGKESIDLQLEVHRHFHG